MSNALQSPYISFIEVKDQVDVISGHLHPGQENILFDLARSIPNESEILEIGSYKGRSTAALGLACFGTGRRVTTIDTFRGKNEDTNEQGDEFFYGEFLANMGRCDLIGYVTAMIGKSSDYWEKWDRPIALLFVDGGHKYEDVKGDVEHFFPWLVEDGWLVMHDVWGHEGGSNTDAVWHETLPRLTDLHLFHNMAWGRKISGKAE